QEGYNEQKVRAICRALLLAIQHCHAHDVIHRDLQPSNMLLSADNSTIKIAGFGQACSVAYGLRNDKCGAPHYVSPEVLESKPYGKPVDMWSMGVTMYTILAGDLPFKAFRQSTMFRHIRKGKYNFSAHSWDNVSTNAKVILLCSSGR
ncbi:unnamed protein product, partial [Sphacelaria rigidula]